MGAYWSSNRTVLPYAHNIIVRDETLHIDEASFAPHVSGLEVLTVVMAGIR